MGRSEQCLAGQVSGGEALGGQVMGKLIPGGVVSPGVWESVVEVSRGLVSTPIASAWSIEGPLSGSTLVTPESSSSVFAGGAGATSFSVRAPLETSGAASAGATGIEMGVVVAERGASTSSDFVLRVGGVFSLLMRRGDGEAGKGVPLDVALGRRCRKGSGMTGSTRLRRTGFWAAEDCLLPELGRTEEPEVGPAATGVFVGAMMSKTIETGGRTWGEAGQPCSFARTCVVVELRQESEVDNDETVNKDHDELERTTVDFTSGGA